MLQQEYANNYNNSVTISEKGSWLFDAKRIRNCEFVPVAETEKAVKIIVDATAFDGGFRVEWLPKSQLESWVIN